MTSEEARNTMHANIGRMNSRAIMQWARTVCLEHSDCALAGLSSDTRACARRASELIQRRLARHNAECARVERLFSIETRLRESGVGLIAGVDEAGRGPLAGPVVAAAVVFEPFVRPHGIDDSKKLAPAKREVLYDQIMQSAHAVGIGIKDVGYIEKHNIARASFDAMKDALFALAPQPDFVLVDAFTIPALGLKQRAIVKGDALSGSIAAASIVAKVTRDRMMLGIDYEYPEYGFCRNKGYGTSEHIDAILAHGVCPEHRMSFLSAIRTRARFSKESRTL